MNPSSDESQIREMFQRVKRADEEQLPSFDSILNRPVVTAGGPSTARPGLVVVCCVAAALLVATALRLLQHGETTETSPPTMENDSVLSGHVVITEPTADVDFDDLHRIVDECFNLSEPPVGEPIPVWSSRTESLLVLNLDVNLDQE